MTENIHDEPTQKDFLENVRDEPILPRSKTAFDVHSEKLSFDMREALLRFMHEHGLSKQDAGIVFSTVLLATERVVEEIPQTTYEILDGAMGEWARVSGDVAERGAERGVLNAYETVAKGFAQASNDMAKTAREEARILSKSIVAEHQAEFRAEIRSMADEVVKSSVAAFREQAKISTEPARSQLLALKNDIREARDSVKALTFAKLWFGAGGCYLAGVASAVIVSMRFL